MLDRKPREKNEGKLVLNITYHPAYARIKDVLSKMHLLLTPDAEHQSVFPSLSVVGFKRGKSRIDFLVREKLPQVKAKEGCLGKCDGKRCGVCNYISETSTFKDGHGGKFTILIQINWTVTQKMWYTYTMQNMPKTICW